MAREERVEGNLGGPETSRRANCGSQSGKSLQRQEEGSEAILGVRSVHSSQGQTGQGADTITQPAQETSAVRTTAQSWSTSLRAIANKAVQNKTHRFGGLYRLLNQANLRECFFQLRKDAAPGVDGVTFEEYEKNLEENLRSLVQRLMNQSYRARLVRRKYIPKGNGKLRPLGIPTLEDKLVQLAVGQILSVIFEADFLPCSYGYRLGRSPHEAVRELTDALYRGRYEFVYEADIKGFFDHIRHDWLVRMLEQRINDGAIIRLIRKWLRAGILEEDGRIEHPESGTPQGGIVSPVLANVYLHYVLDLWFERKVRKTNRGQSRLFRFADDFVCCFDYRHEAQALASAVQERLAKFGLELALDKTQTLRFGRNGGGHNGRFDFLGFEFRWEKSRTRGHAIVKRRTSRKKLRGAVERFTEWIREHRHQKLKPLMETVAQKHQGHWNYYGIIGNSESLRDYRTLTLRTLFKWLNRRSQRGSYTWQSFNRLLQRFSVPLPRITDRASNTELRSPPKWRAGQAGGVNLFGQHYVASRV
jgi:group II intron reverse transcriptase/maturase